MSFVCENSWELSLTSLMEITYIRLESIFRLTNINDTT